MGSIINSIQGCYPTTTQCGGFELLSFDPGPVHLSLDNLEAESYDAVNVMMEFGTHHIAFLIPHS